MQRISTTCLALTTCFLASCQPGNVVSETMRRGQGPTTKVPGLYGKYAITDAKARAVVEAMHAVYAKCKTYTDTGTYFDQETRMTFITRFRRPDRLYFEFTAKDNVRDGRFVYWTTGVRKKIFHNGVDGPGYWDDTVLTNSWYGDAGEFEKDSSLGMTVAGFTGISSCTGTNVPNMIFVNEIGSLNLSDMADLVFEGTAKERGVECDVLYSKKYLTRAWIDKKAHLLRKMSERFEQSDPEMVIEYLPKIDVEVSDEQLTFKPPVS